jgi:hypothetical protein
MGLTGQRIKLYDGKELWEVYHGWGRASSYTRLEEWHKAEKGFGSRMGMFWAMWRYASHNPQEAYEFYKAHNFEYMSQGLVRARDGRAWKSPIEAKGVATFADFLEDCRNHARSRKVMGKKNYLEFCRKWGLQE